ncbi:ACT domain-containing protein [Pseudonocardia parietis]|uniref:Maleate cis-trans isomerase n=1 Tax=Pseudonocardia parietis TaxID=570936 RepID=A0ABS4VYC6_9PSEU|nr:ACT domain-containing protein [Pseudonocardia parietis]MBP2368801.1 maleate cis-trans isomerase [Pseudonocardia parietis]
MDEQLFPETRGGPGVGVVVPYDFAQDREMWRWVPEPTSLHVTRTPFVAIPADAGQARLVSDPEMVRRAVQDVLLPEPGVVAYSCTSGSFVGGAEGERALRAVIRDAGAPQAVTTAGSLVEACTALGVDRLALATPYVDDLTDKLEGFLAAHGVGTVSRHGLGLLGHIWHVSPAEVVRAVRAADHPDAEAVFVSCTNLPTYDVIARLERELGKPVLTANQVTMWAALSAAGLSAVGPGQALIERRAPGDRPVLRVVAPGDTTDLPADPDEMDGAGLPSLHKVRVRMPDESGALARLTAAVADAGGNILSLSVHGQDSRSVVDEMLVGGTLSAARLVAVIRGALNTAGPDAVRVVPADPHELVDGPTRALDLVAGCRGRDAAGLLEGLAALLRADEIDVAPAGTAPDDEHALVLPTPLEPRMVARRQWAPFTVTERARAEAFVRAATADAGRTAYEVLLPDGTELVASPATGAEFAELDTLVRACLDARPDGAPSDVEWTTADLRAVLLPPGGACMVVRTADGTLVAAGSRPQTEESDPAAVPEPVVMVHPQYRGHRLAEWLRRKLTTAIAA